MATHQTPKTTEKKPVTHKLAQPFSDFRHEMDHLFEKFFSARPGFDFRVPVRESFSTLETPLTGMIMPEIDIRENKKTITVRAELPGMDKNDVQLTLQEGVLTIKGEKKIEKETEKDHVKVMECRYGTFERSLTLPSSVDQSKVKAKFKNGVLTVRVPKLAEKKWPEKKIQIG